jgi:hypothetical protein
MTKHSLVAVGGDLSRHLKRINPCRSPDMLPHTIIGFIYTLQFYELTAVSQLYTTSKCWPLKQKRKWVAKIRYQAPGICIVLKVNRSEEYSIVYYYTNWVLHLMRVEGSRSVLIFKQYWPIWEETRIRGNYIKLEISILNKQLGVESV